MAPAVTYMQNGFRPFRITVLFEGRKVGEIRESKGGAGGYYYRTSGGGAGDIYSTVEAVKKSLEGEAS